MELVSPIFPTFFLLILCIASVTKVSMVINLSTVATRGFYLQAIVGVAGGATRAALTQHQARRNNMADVSAKDGSQVSKLLEELSS